MNEAFCKDCIDFNTEKNKCWIRFTITQFSKNKAVKELMSRKPTDKACEVFASKQQP